MADLLTNQDPLYNGDTIRTFTGKYVNVFEPDPDLIDIEDIAHGLAYQPRFAGHTQVFVSVAQHSLFVCTCLEKPLQLEGLLHDATEAYLCDIPRPIKKRFPEYKKIEERLMECIAEKYGLKFPFPPEIKHQDRLALEWEFQNAMIDNSYISMDPLQAKSEFLKLAKNLLILRKEVSNVY